MPSPSFKRLQSSSPYALSLLRFFSSLVFLGHGSGKLLGFPHLSAVPHSFTLVWWGGVIELIGGVLLALGLFSRPVAFIMSGEMAVAYFTAHYPKSFFPTLNGGDAAVLFCFIFLYIAFAGPGPVSVDALRGHRS